MSRDRLRQNIDIIVNMLKYTDTQIVFEEIPDEITLAINISNCPNHCPGCHSPYLREDIGEELYGDTLMKLIAKNEGITCVLFMGEGKDEEHLFRLIDLMHNLNHNDALFSSLVLNGRKLKIGLYTGSEHVSEFLWENLDYIKLGPYIEELGPLNNPNTNQRLYKHEDDIEKKYSTYLIDGKFRPRWHDITYRFWRKGTE